MFNTLYLPELREMLAENNSDQLSEFCTALHPARIAEYMGGLEPHEAWEVLRHAELPVRVEIFSFFPHEQQQSIIESQDISTVAELVANLPPDDRVDLLQHVDESIVDEILPLLPQDERRDFLRLQAYPEGTAGAVMTTEVVKLAETLGAAEALEVLGDQAEEVETIYYLFVVDDTNHLRGVVSARQLVSALSRPNTRLVDLMETDLVVAEVMEDQENVAQKVAHYDLLAIPVVDDQHQMLGIITHDDVIDVLREEATEDAHRIAGVDPLERGYLQTHILTMSWKRGVWLTILFFAALLTAFALQHYERSLEQFGWLVVFIPLVISSGGNTGSQSATLIITALATGDIRVGDWVRVVRRELAMGMVLGSFLGAIGFVAGYFFTGSLQTAVVVPITLLLVVMCGTLSGSLLPLLFQRLGWDPALMSNPFVAGIVDILGIVIYMNVAMAILPPPVT